MAFEGTLPYGTPGGFPGNATVADVDPDIRRAFGKGYVAFLLINGTVADRFRFEVESVVRTLSGTGLDVVAILIQEGDAATGAIIDTNLAQLRFLAQDFVVTELAPGIVLISIESNRFASAIFMTATDVSSTLVGTDVLFDTFTLLLPNSGPGTWVVMADAFSEIDTSGPSSARYRCDIVHAGGTVTGASNVESATAGRLQRRAVARASGVAGAQTVTVNVVGQQAGAGTITKYQTVARIDAYRES